MVRISLCSFWKNISGPTIMMAGHDSPVTIAMAMLFGESYKLTR